MYRDVRDLMKGDPFMKSISRIDMAEVTRLTRSGQLEKAMQLLREGSGARDEGRLRPWLEGFLPCSLSTN